MKRWVTRGRRSKRLSAKACLLGSCLIGWGCGSAESSTLFVPEPEPAPLAEPEQTPAAPTMTPPPAMNEVTDPSPPLDPPGEGGAAGEMTAPPPSNEDPEDTRLCKPALGVPGAPETISQALILLNTLPKPVTLACFVEALDRPLTVYLTKSDESLQPSPGARSPRTFILRGELAMSIVLDGVASNTLEFGFRAQPGRSIKAEIEFPLRTDVSETSLFDRVQVTPRTTKCGACHVGEGHLDYPGFPLGVFESDVLAPFGLDEISVEALQAERASCDAAAEPYRCGLLAALFDHGEVVQGLLRGPEDSDPE